jgi:hypothetical protein
MYVQARSQPDNSGGFQRCVLVAAGTNTAPVTASTCVHLTLTLSQHGARHRLHVRALLTLTRERSPVTAFTRACT